MKHLKKFNESLFTKDDVSEVIDLFQDIIDEYDLYDVSNGTQIPDKLSAYDISIDKRDNKIQLYLYIDPSMEDKIEEVDNKIENEFIERINQIGFKVKFIKKNSMISYVRSIDITQKNIKSFNESKLNSGLSEDDFNDIMDMFQEYIDDYDLVKRSPLENSSPAYKIYLDNTHQISFYVGMYSPDKKNLQLIELIQRLENEFFKRLEDIGYIVRSRKNDKLDPTTWLLAYFS